MTDTILQGGMSIDVTGRGTFVVSLFVGGEAPVSVRMGRMDALRLIRRLSECLMMTEVGE